MGMAITGRKHQFTSAIGLILEGSPVPFQWYSFSKARNILVFHQQPRIFDEGSSAIYEPYNGLLPVCRFIGV
jgi:hypothetical protein